MTKVLILPFLSCAVTSYAALNYAITGVQNQLVGSSAVVVSGNATNFSGNATVGQFAIFDVSDGASFNGQLRITYAADLGTPGNIGSKIMIARTVDSQGLTDAGTFSVLIQQNNNLDQTPPIELHGARLQIDWFQAGTYTGITPNFNPLTRTISPVVNFTTFDIDFQQYVRVQKSALSAYQRNTITQLTATDNGTTIQFADPAPDANSVFNDPQTAVEFTTVATSSYYIDVGSLKAGTNQFSLFMFEMRDPSSNVTVGGPPVVVPEPATFAGLLGLASLMVIGRRRRLKV